MISITRIAHINADIYDYRDLLYASDGIYGETRNEKRLSCHSSSNIDGKNHLISMYIVCLFCCSSTKQTHFLVKSHSQQAFYYYFWSLLLLVNPFRQGAISTGFHRKSPWAITNRKCWRAAYNTCPIPPAMDFIHVHCNINIYLLYGRTKVRRRLYLGAHHKYIFQFMVIKFGVLLYLCFTLYLTFFSIYMSHDNVIKALLQFFLVSLGDELAGCATEEKRQRAEHARHISTMM